MKAKITFTPQAWQNDYAIDIDPKGETEFTVDVKALQEWDADALKYNLEPYLNLPETPEWIREWDGPFWADVEPEGDAILLIKVGDGVLTTHAGEFKLGEPRVWSIQNPNLMDPTDPDKSWYAIDEDEGETLGPFDDLDEVREYLSRYESVDDWRGEVCAALRHLGAGDLADEFGRYSDQQAMAYRDTHEDPKAAAAFIASESRDPQAGRT